MLAGGTGWKTGVIGAKKDELDIVSSLSKTRKVEQLCKRMVYQKIDFRARGRWNEMFEDLQDL